MPPRLQCINSLNGYSNTCLFIALILASTLKRYVHCRNESAKQHKKHTQSKYGQVVKRRTKVAQRLLAAFYSAIMIGRGAHVLPNISSNSCFIIHIYSWKCKFVVKVLYPNLIQDYTVPATTKNEQTYVLRCYGQYIMLRTFIFSSDKYFD